MKTLKVLLQEVVSGIKAWVNSNFAQESNAVHKTGDETVNGVKTFTGTVFHQNSRSIYRNTNIQKSAPSAYTAVDTFSHLGSDGAYWGGLKHLWKTDGTSITELAVANYRLNGENWNMGFWSLQLSIPKDFSQIVFHPSNSDVINLGSSSLRWKNVYSVGVLGNVFETLPGTTGLVLRSTDQTWENGSRIFLYSNSHTGQTNGSIYADVDHGDENHTKSAVILLPGIFYPVGGGTNGINLGDSTHRWKTLNGINPGALSLATTDTSKIDYFNGDITDKTGGANNKTFAVDGWITVIIPNVSGDFIAIDNSIGQTVSISGTGVGHSSIDIFCPVRAGVQVTILCKCSGGSVLAAHTWCEGSV